MLTAEPHLSILLPCNVTIRSLGGDDYEVAVMEPAAAMSVAKNPAIEDLAGEVRGKLMRNLELL